MALFAFAVSRGSSRAAGGDPSSFAHGDAVRRATWTTGSTDSTAGSWSGTDSSGSGSSFGGGSSDGGGATGSW